MNKKAQTGVEKVEVGGDPVSKKQLDKAYPAELFGSDPGRSFAKDLRDPIREHTDAVLSEMAETGSLESDLRHVSFADTVRIGEAAEIEDTRTKPAKTCACGQEMYFDWGEPDSEFDQGSPTAWYCSGKLGCGCAEKATREEIRAMIDYEDRVSGRSES